MATIQDKVVQNLIERLVGGDRRLFGVPAPIVEAVARRALDELEQVAPSDAKLDDILNGEWGGCEGCSALFPQEVLTLVDTEDSVHLCPQCMTEMAKDAEQGP